MGEPALIGLDWGTSSNRAFLIGADGNILQQRSSGKGIKNTNAETLRSVLDEAVGDSVSQYPHLKILASGMIGSKNGWHEVRYLRCPLNLRELSNGIIKFPNQPLHIVPGVLQNGESADVMRGEETQILGLLAKTPDLRKASTVVLPGTHSKWVSVKQGGIRCFKTWMTGELFEVLIKHSLLGAFATPTDDGPKGRAEFLEGVARVRRQGEFGSQLVFVRSGVLADELTNDACANTLSGILIRGEIQGALNDGFNTDGPLIVVGSHEQGARYMEALGVFGISAQLDTTGTSAFGLFTLAQSHDFCEHL